jgi:putative transcriptional regulator
VRALVAAALLAAASAAPAQPANGVLLVAKPTIVDPNFSRTVVLVTQTPGAETVGVVLNRPTPLPASEVLPPELPSGNYKDSVYIGGPVLREVVVALFHSERPPAAPAFHVLKDVYLTMHPDNIKMLLESAHRRYRLYLGFAGWAPRQLEAEMARDGWYVLPAEEDLLFRPDTSGLWQELLQQASSPHASIAPERKGPARAVPGSPAADARSVLRLAPALYFHNKAAT